LLGKVIGEGGRLLAELARKAVARLLLRAEGPIGAGSLWTPEERQRLADELAAATATAGTLARSLVLDHAERAKRKDARVTESVLREGEDDADEVVGLDVILLAMLEVGDDPDALDYLMELARHIDDAVAEGCDCAEGNLLEAVKAGFSGEIKDRLGRRICYSNGKRVSCGKSAPAKKETPAKAARATPDEVHGRIGEILKDPSSITTAHVEEVKTLLSGLTLPQIGEVKKRLGVTASGVKAKQVQTVAEKALAASQAKKTAARKPAAKPAKPAPAPAKPQPAARKTAAKPADRPKEFTPANAGKITAAIENSSLMRDRDAGIPNFAFMHQELKNLAPDLTPQQFQSFAAHLARSGAVEPHAFNGKHGLQPWQTEHAYKPDPKDPSKNKELFIVHDRAKLAQGVRDYLASKVKESVKGVDSTDTLPVPVRLQDTDFSCGAACFEAILNYLGIPLDEAELIAALPSTPSRGTRSADMLALAERLGLATEERHGASLDDVRFALEGGAPVLCPVQLWGGGHWVVVTGVDDAVHLMDPVSGLVTVPLDEWEANWWDEAEGERYDHYALAIGQAVQEATQTQLKHNSAQLKHNSALHRLLEDTRLPALQPEAALDFFRSLVPTLGADPHRLDSYRRTAFTLAVATEQELLVSVQQVILDRLTSGLVGTGPAAVQAVLDAAGVSAANPAYAENVFRTNAMDSYVQASQDQIQAQADLFPVYLYSNPADSRSRPTHAERDGKYYPSTVPFTQVRGTTKEDVINCRCVPVPIDRRSWSDLKNKGMRIADGYVDPTG
jgi:predicted double-glycine peptidase